MIVLAAKPSDVGRVAHGGRETQSRPGSECIAVWPSPSFKVSEISGHSFLMDLGSAISLLLHGTGWPSKLENTPLYDLHVENADR